ncbi:carbohydrate ABC transporter permease [Thiohalomonas denitrificans]|uniref:Trehalose/maltose transport system permease protein n=1 Tax=Thiohalomonas denitrificans TaxID=415747 RepID=A0A1G5QF69_9GAMM|nr:sugar ABC transporter permease [Thiohalomonas denitrificans]SCZ60246.1 trehalose/maltose transport system permease protein [Thiohalomonas denitrificans]
MGPLARKRARAAWWFLLPSLAVLLLTAGWPLLRTVGFGFTDAYLGNLENYSFVGLDNFILLYQDPFWWQSVRNTLFFTITSVSLELVLGLTIALILNVALPGRGLMRAAVLIPWAIPTIVSARMWQWMYNDLYGVFNQMLMGVGVIAEPIAWTADPALSLWSVVAVDVWKTTPFVALLALAALQLVPGELYEAARVDGVHPVKIFFRITLPLIMPALLVAMVFRMLDALRIFDLIYILTSGSPSTMSMSVYARRHLVEFQDVGYGSAASTFLFALVALITAIVLTLGRSHLAREVRR